MSPELRPYDALDAIQKINIQDGYVWENDVDPETDIFQDKTWPYYAVKKTVHCCRDFVCNSELDTLLVALTGSESVNTW